MLISWNTTQACNIHCLHCYRDAGERRDDELSTEEGKKLIREIAQAGFKILVLSGGEPLLRPDLTELIAYARQTGLRPVLGTNGTLIDLPKAQELKAAGLAAAGISVDSRRPELHNHFRQSPGAWEKTMRGIEACRGAGLPFQLHTTVLDWNESEITDITDMAVELGAVAHHIFFLVPTGRAVNIEAATLRTQQYEDLLNRIVTKQQETPIEIKPTCAPQFMRIARMRNLHTRFTKGCLAGTSYCVILPNGDVQSCPYLPIKAGNIRQTPFNILWRESPLFQDLRQKPLNGKCGACVHGGICGGCRARAYYYSGDYLGSEPWCNFM